MNLSALRWFYWFTRALHHNADIFTSTLKFLNRIVCSLQLKWDDIHMRIFLSSLVLAITALVYLYKHTFFRYYNLLDYLLIAHVYICQKYGKMEIKMRLVDLLYDVLSLELSIWLCHYLFLLAEQSLKQIQVSTRLIKTKISFYLLTNNHIEKIYISFNSIIIIKCYHRWYFVPLPREGATIGMYRWFYYEM